MDELIANGRVIRGYLGISSVEINPIVARMLNLGTCRGWWWSLIPMAHSHQGQSQTWGCAAQDQRRPSPAYVPSWTRS